MKKQVRLSVLVVMIALLLLFSACTRHKRGTDAFEHYFGVNPPDGVVLIQAHWAGFYYPFGLDSEQMLLEFVAPEDAIKKLLGASLAADEITASPEQRERIFGWKTMEVEALGRGLESAPKWFTPVDSKRYELGFLGGESAIVRFFGEPSRYAMVVYDSGRGYIFADLVASRVYVTQVRGRLF